MGEQETARVEGDLNANEATLDLLRRRIESDAWKSTLLYLGLPLGSGGVLAIAAAVFISVPRLADDFVTNSDTAKDTVKAAAERYLVTDKGRQAVQSQIQPSVNNAFGGEPERSGAVSTRFG
ncbi:MAG: hypothetical protein ACYTKD_17300 [Planctomycetota bacterium]|jgi:hypothetical protein